MNMSNDKKHNWLPEDSRGLALLLTTPVKTKSFKRLWNRFEALAKTIEFNKKVKRLRKKYQVKFGAKNEDINCTNNWPLQQELFKIMEKYGFNAFAWEDTFNRYIAHGEVIKPDMFESEGLGIMITTKEDESEEPFSDCIINHNNNLYPIHIRISPHCSRREIIDYIEKMYTPYIKPLQKLYINKNPEKRYYTRRQENVKKYDFIYKNRDKTLKEISTLLGQEFGSNSIIEESLIAKIISIEEKRRKKV